MKTLIGLALLAISSTSFAYQTQPAQICVTNNGSAAVQFKDIGKFQGNSVSTNEPVVAAKKSLCFKPNLPFKIGFYDLNTGTANCIFTKGVYHYLGSPYEFRYDLLFSNGILNIAVNGASCKVS